VTEEEAYMHAMEELRTNSVQRAIWIKAIAHSNGDENSARAKYLLFRAEVLRQEDRSRRVEEKIIAGKKLGGTAFRFLGAATGLFVAVTAIVCAILGMVSLSESGIAAGGIVGLAVGVLLASAAYSILKKFG
jgi:hypothetical protein